MRYSERRILRSFANAMKEVPMRVQWKGEGEILRWALNRAANRCGVTSERVAEVWKNHAPGYLAVLARRSKA